jgi:hypothetical protein
MACLRQVAIGTLNPHVPLVGWRSGNQPDHRRVLRRASAFFDGYL